MPALLWTCVSECVDKHKNTLSIADENKIRSAIDALLILFCTVPGTISTRYDRYTRLLAPSYRCLTPQRLRHIAIAKFDAVGESSSPLQGSFFPFVLLAGWAAKAAQPASNTKKNAKRSRRWEIRERASPRVSNLRIAHCIFSWISIITYQSVFILSP